MSRIGKKPIQLPEKVKATIQGREVQIEGPKGKLVVQITEGVEIKIEDGAILVTPAVEDREARARQGLLRALLANAVNGVHQSFTRVLEINGVGYRAEAKGPELHLALGYSHPVVYDVPEGVKASTPAPNRIVLEGADKQAVGMSAAQIRMLRPPEPYKGKGIKYAEETIRRKVGKTGA